MEACALSKADEVGLKNSEDLGLFGFLSLSRAAVDFLETLNVPA